MKYDIVSDIHGCFGELCYLLEKIGYIYNNKEELFIPPEGRKLILVGDLVDRGPHSGAVLIMVERMYAKEYLNMVRGNHDDRLRRWAGGSNVMITHGLDKTLADIEKLGIEKDYVFEFIKKIPYFLLLDESRLAVVHASWADKLLTRDPYSKRCRYRCLHGPNNGLDDNGYAIRIDWAKQRIVNENSPIVVYGHQVQKDVRHINKTYGIDTGCVFGGKLTALRYPEMEIVQVDAYNEYCKKGDWPDYE